VKKISITKYGRRVECRCQNRLPWAGSRVGAGKILCSKCIIFCLLSAPIFLNIELFNYRFHLMKQNHLVDCEKICSYKVRATGRVPLSKSLPWAG